MEFFKFVILGMPVWFWSFPVFMAAMFILMIINKRKQDKLYWEEHDLSNATPMIHHALTQPFGTEAFVLSPHKWVIIEWDKNKNKLNIWEPKHTYKTPVEYHLGKGTLNWKMNEKPRPHTTVEQHFKRQVM